MPSTLDESGCPIYSAFMDNSAPNVAVQCDVKKQCDNISYVKQKIFESDYVIRQYKKKILLDNPGRFERFNNSQDVYNNACFNEAASSELNNNCDVIPQAVGLTATEKAELEGRLASTEIKIQEMKSHINQLQMLVTEYETQIEAMKIENQLQKCNAKEYNNLINDICLFRDIVLGRKNLQNRHKKVLMKYDKYKSSSAVDENTQSSIDELEIFSSKPSAKTAKKSSKNKSNQAKGLLCETSTVNKSADKDGKLMVQVNGRPDSDSGNIIMNEDSGFSSLGINSPDYYPDNSPCSTVSSQKEKKSYVDIATSPITVKDEGVEVIDTHKTSSDSTKSLKKQEECVNCSLLSNSIPNVKTYADAATSPITVQESLFEIIIEDKDCASRTCSQIDNGFNNQDILIRDNILSGTSRKEKPNGTNTLQEKNCKPMTCSEIENDFNITNEPVSDYPPSTRLQEEKDKVNGSHSMEENLVEMIDADKNCESLADSEKENFSSSSARSLKEKINNDEANTVNNDVNIVQEQQEILNEDNDNISLCDTDIIEGCLFDQDSCDKPLDSGTKKDFSDTATSPITVKETLDMATSPIPFIDRKSNNLSDEISITLTNDANDIVATKTIGINTIHIKQREIATSPVKFDIISGDQRTASDKLSSEVECLELNNSKKLNDSCFDCEVETILRNMRLDCEFITPMPKTPVKLHNTESPSCCRCRDMAKLRKENENLQSTFQDIAKSMFNMTWLMKSRGLLANNLHNDWTSLDKSNINIRALNAQTENIPNDLHNSTVNKNLPTVVIDDIDSFEIAIDENNVNNDDVLINRIENVPDDFCKIAGDINQPSSTPILKSVEICNKQNSVVNDQVINRPEENVSNEFHSDVNSQNQSTVNTDCGESLEVEKEQNIEMNMNQNCDMHVDNENVTKSPTKTAQKVKRSIKLTKLEKWKKKFIPKSKIRAMTPPIRKVTKQQQITNKKISEHTSKLIEENKAAYKKAVKVMAELRDKEKNKAVTKPSIMKGLDRNNVCKKELRVILSKCDDMIPKYARKANLQNHVQINDPTNNDTVMQKETHSDKTPSSPSVTTRSQSKRLSCDLFNSPETDIKKYVFDSSLHENEDSETNPRRGRKRCASEILENTPKRLPQEPTTAQFTNKIITSNTDVIETPHKNPKSIVDRRSNHISCLQGNSRTKDSLCNNSKEVLSYNDLDVFIETKVPENNKQQTHVEEKKSPKDRILCRMLEKYARNSIKLHVKKKPETKINAIAQKLEEGIANIISVAQSEAKQAMDDFVDEIQNCDRKIFVMGLMKYLKEPARRDELFNKVSAPPAPQMTRAEQVLLYVLRRLRAGWAPGDLVETVLQSIEYTLFHLNDTPEFGAVESLSHLYAILCRYFVSKSRLRLFILDAMYCIHFKSVALIKQCLDVWMHILPLAHMGLAKSPLVMCLIYLLHFFKCNDRYNRVQEMRTILSRKYFYEVTEWTESKMLEMFKNALLEIREIPVEKKMLRMSLIILAKRKGPQWCQKNIIKDMIQPLIEKKGVPARVKEFCVSVLGPLLKPYPNDMRVHCEVVANQLMEMLDHNAKPSMQEAVFTSLLYMRRHNPPRVCQALLAWRTPRVTSEMERLLRDYVREKPAKVWRHILAKTPID